MLQKPVSSGATNVTSKIRRMVSRRPSITVDELMERLGDHKPSRFTVRSIRADQRAAIKVLKKLDLLKYDPEF